MRMIVLSALFAAGVGLTGISTANAAPAAGLSTALVEGSLIQDIQYYRGGRCRTVRVCRSGPYGRRCRTERVCGRRW